jgi:hypothetical protein
MAVKELRDLDFAMEDLLELPEFTVCALASSVRDILA